MTDSQADRGKGTTKEEDTMAFHNLVGALNDLDKGQKEVLSAINRLTDKPRKYKHKLHITQGDRANISDNGIQEHTTMHNNPHIYHKSSKPTMSQFL